MNSEIIGIPTRRGTRPICILREAEQGEEEERNLGNLRRCGKWIKTGANTQGGGGEGAWVGASKGGYGISSCGEHGSW